MELSMARMTDLMDRRPLLHNSVLLRQNPHNVHVWHERVKLYEGEPMLQIDTFTEAVTTVDPAKVMTVCRVALERMFFFRKIPI